MKPYLNASWLLAVSFFGLISCQKNPSQLDEWDVKSPVVQSASHQGHTTELHAGFSGQLPADSTITFESNGKGEIQSISVHADCVKSETHLAQDRRISNSSSLALSTLLPNQILLALREEPTSCIFKIVVENEHGSTRSFSTGTIVIDHLEGLQNVTLQKTSYQAREFEELDLTPDLPAIKATSTKNTFYALACDEFLNTRLPSGGVSHAETLKALVEENILLGPALTPVTDATQDSRFANSVQNCRLVVLNETPNADANLYVTSRFKIEFPIVNPEISITTTARFQENKNLQNLALATVTVKNLNPVPVAYAFSNFAGPVSAKTVSTNNQNLMIFTEMLSTDIHPTLGFSSRSRNWKTSFGHLIEVPAHGQAVVEVIIDSSVDCANRDTPVLDTPSLADPKCRADGGQCVIIGKINLTLPDGVLMSRVQNWNGSPDLNTLAVRAPLQIAPRGFSISLQSDFDVRARAMPHFESVNPEIAAKYPKFYVPQSVCR